jgi:ketosteroid isomerase-like protein
MNKFTMVLFVCFALTGCNSVPRADLSAEADGIRILEDQWTAALQESDAEKILSFYAADAVNMSSNKPIITGLEAIADKIKSDLADTSLNFKTYKGTVDAVEISTSGDLAYARGHDEISMKTKDGIVKEEGKWVDIWKKIDGQWKVVVSIGSSNQPAAGQ